jgi:peptide/nickel transport system substrate-binding protein
VSARAAALASLLALALASAAGGAARARLGGTLSLGLLGLSPPAAGALADTPEAASARALLALPLCRLEPLAVPVVASAHRRAAGAEEEVVVTPLAAARLPDGSALGPGDVAASWRRLSATEGGGLYLSLLAPVAGLEAALDAALQHPEAGLVLPLAYPWPDLEASLCHPALTATRAGLGAAPALGVGLYAKGSDGRWAAAHGAPRGPPFASALAFSALAGGRAAPRLLQRGEVQAVLGEAAAGGAGPLLFATYLAYRPGALPPGALAALQALDLAALVRTFVPGPAVPMRGLLPPAFLEPPLPAARRSAALAVPAAGAARSFTLGFDVALPEQRAVAERLQVLLHDAGYRVRVEGLERAALARARAAGNLEAALVSVLLPPLAAPALALVLAASGQPELLGQELPALGSLPDAGARAARVRERALALQGVLPLIPLFARGLRARLSPSLVAARTDGFGLLVLDDAWLTD